MKGKHFFRSIRERKKGPNGIFHLVSTQVGAGLLIWILQYILRVALCCQTGRVSLLMPRQFLHPQLLQCGTAGPHPSVDAPTTTHQWIIHGRMSCMLSWIISIGFSSWNMFRDRRLGKKGAGHGIKATPPAQPVYLESK